MSAVNWAVLCECDLVCV